MNCFRMGYCQGNAGAFFYTELFHAAWHVTASAIRLLRFTQASQPAHTLVASIWPGQWIRETPDLIRIRFRDTLDGYE